MSRTARAVARIASTNAEGLTPEGRKYAHALLRADLGLDDRPPRRPVGWTDDQVRECARRARAALKDLEQRAGRPGLAGEAA